MAKSKQKGKQGGKQTRAINYKGMEPDYIVNVKSLRILAEEYGGSPAGIIKHFNKLEIKRGPKGKIRARADELVNRKEAVNSDVNREHHSSKNDIEVAATLQAETIMGHRTGIKKRLALAEKLFKELEGMVDGNKSIPALVKALKENDKDGFVKAIEKVLSLPEAIKMFDQMMKAYNVGVGMQREAVGIEKKFTLGDDEPDGFEVVFRGTAKQ